MFCLNYDAPIDLDQSVDQIVDQVLTSGELCKTNGAMESWVDESGYTYSSEEFDWQNFFNSDRECEEAIRTLIRSDFQYRDVVPFNSTKPNEKGQALVILHGIVENDRLMRLMGRVEILPGSTTISRNQSAFQTLIEHIPDLIYFKDQKHQFVLVNREKAEEVNQKPYELTGKTDADYFPPHIAKECIADDQQVLETGEPIVGKEEYIISPDGQGRWRSTTKIPWRDHTGAIIGTMGISRDISDLKQMNQVYNAMYKISEAVHYAQTLDDLYETIHEILQELLPAKNMYIAIYNEEADTIRFPYYKDENDYSPPKERESGNGLTEYVIRTGKPFIASEQNLDELREHGEIELTGPPSNDWLGVPLKTTRGILGVITIQTYQENDAAYSQQDAEMLGFVSELIAQAIQRKKAERQLSKEQEQLAVTLKSIGDGVITTDLEGRVLLLNKMASKLSGWPEEEAKGRPLDEIFNVVHNNTGERVLPDIFEVIRSQELYLLPPESVLIRKNGERLHIADSIAPLRDDQSNIIGAVIVFRDITKQRKLEEELLRTRKLESVGVLAGGIAHDFNNILSSILGNISLARMALQGSEDKVETLLRNAEEGSKRASQFTKQLLTFAKGGAPVKETADLKALIEETTEFTLRGSNVRPMLILDPDLRPASVDTGQIGQVIQNLIINANQAMPEGGTLIIKAQNKDLDNSNLQAGLDPGQYILIEIVDEGIGIAEKHLPKIFDPYFSTKNDGSGLGLATSYTIIQKHNGLLNAISEQGVGTTMQVYLPANGNHQTLERGRSYSNESGIAFKGQGRILVMDDDENVLNMINGMLLHVGFDVETCADGKEAIRLYEEALQNNTPYDAVLLDLTIPGGMGGKETIEHLKSVDPTVTAIVSSGYSTDSIMSDFAQYGFKGKVAKPYSMDELVETMQRVLGEE